MLLHTHEAKVLVDMRDKLLIVVQRVRQVCCSAPSSEHLTDNSAAIHGFPKNLHCTSHFFHTGTMFRKTVLNFFLLMLFLTLRSRKNVLSLFICTSFKWNCIEFIQRSYRKFATTRDYLEWTLVFVRTECKSTYFFCSDICLNCILKILLKIQFSHSSCFWPH